MIKTLRIIFKTKLNHYSLPFIAPLLSVCILVFISSQLSINAKSEISFTKTLSRTQFIYLLIYVIINLLAYFLKKTITFENQCTIFLTFFLAYLVSIRFFTLSGTPFDFSQGFGAGDKNNISRMVVDLGANLNYPPGLPFLTGLFAQIFGLEPPLGMKYAQTFLLVVGIIIIYGLLRIQIDNYFATFFVIAITYNFMNFGDEYKIIPLFILPIIALSLVRLNQSEFSIKFKLTSNIILSSTLSVSILTYSGPFFWSSPLLFLTLGFIMFELLKNLKKKEFFILVSSILVPFAVITYPHFYPFIKNIFNSANLKQGSILVGDSFMDPAAINTVFRPLMTLDVGFQGIIILFTLMVILSEKNQVQKFSVILLFGYLSSILMQLILNLNWQRTGYLELWPRGWLSSGFYMYSLFSIGLYLVSRKIINVSLITNVNKAPKILIFAISITILISLMSLIDKKFTKFSYLGEFGNGTRIAQDAVNFEIPCYENC